MSRVVLAAHPLTGHVRPILTIAADLANLGRPRTAVGFLVAALYARRDAGLPPFTAISCDNLPGNGALLRDAVLELACARDRSLAAWIGLVPKQHSTGGKDRLGSITKHGNRYLRPRRRCDQTGDRAQSQDRCCGDREHP
mgnify:CR=1 FL=1